MSEIDTSDEQIAAIADVLLGWLTGPDDGQNDGLMDAYNALHALLRERNEARAGVAQLAHQWNRLQDILGSPPHAAILRGEAVAVPKEATPDMLIAGAIAWCEYEHKHAGEDHTAVDPANAAYIAMLGVSPYIQRDDSAANTV